jgi:hypothetical protein
MTGPSESFDPYAQWLGIGPHERPLHHYRLLGLELFEADAGKISAAADERMLLLRQYQTGPRGTYTQKLLNEVAAARVCLLSATQKKDYDQWLRNLLQPPTHAAAPPPRRRNLAEVMPPGWDGEANPLLEPPPEPPAAPPVSAESAQASSEQDAPLASPPLSGDKRLVLGLGLLILLVAMFGGIAVSLSGRFSRRPTAEANAPLGDEVNPNEENAAAANSGTTDGTPEGTTPAEPAASPVPTKAIVLLQEGSGEVNFPPATALLSGNVAREVAGTQDVLRGWAADGDQAEWHFQLVRPGFFELELVYVANEALRGQPLRVELDDEGKTYPLRAPESAGAIVRDTHIVVFKKSGQHRLRLRPGGEWGDGQWQLNQLRLIPAVGS